MEEQRKLDVDRVNAVDMRKKALEIFGETKKRKVDAGEEVEKKPKRRRSGNETMEFIRLQTERELLMREREKLRLKEKNECKKMKNIMIGKKLWPSKWQIKINK